MGQTAKPPNLVVDGDVAKKLSLNASDLAAMPRRSVNVSEKDGTKAVYEGIPVAEILQRAGVGLGKDFKKTEMSLCVLATAADGYRVVFALVEFDPGFTDQTILLADRRDGQPLSAHEGPLRIIVPSDKRPGRWEREVSSLTVRQVQ